MIRILHIVTNMDCGGLETMIMNYYRKIDRKQIQFDFLVHRSEKAYFDEEIMEMGGIIYHLPKLNPFSKNYLNKLKSFFKNHKEYKIVHCHLDCMSAIPLKVAREFNVPVRIAHSHNSNQTKDFKYLLKRFYKRQITCVATDLFACSYDAGEWMFKTTKFEVMPNAIDCSKYIYDINKQILKKKELGLKDESIIGHIGRFSPQKNHKFLLEIFKRVNEKEPNSKLLLIGQGQLCNSIKTYVHKLDLEEKVKFLGVRKDIPDLLQVMDVFLFPSLYEGLPVTIIEAQSAGLPCIISDKVPIECKKTDLVQQIGLKQDVDFWADVVLQAANRKRRDTYKEMVASGYDINMAVIKLQKFYLRKYQEI